MRPVSADWYTRPAHTADLTSLRNRKARNRSTDVRVAGGRLTVKVYLKFMQSSASNFTTRMGRNGQVSSERCQCIIGTLSAMK